MTEHLSEPHLILHLVRGEPEFGVAVQRNGEWVICSSGRRAWPFKTWPLADLVDASDINYVGRHNRPIDFLDTIPEGWPDHATSISSVECPHCHCGFAPSVIGDHIREKHSRAVANDLDFLFGRVE